MLFNDFFEDSVTHDMNFSEKEKEFVFMMALPGLSKEDLEIKLGDNRLTLKGERKNFKEGKFSYDFKLPYACSSENAEAKMENGVLTLTFPKASEAKTKLITIN